MVLCFCRIARNMKFGLIIEDEPFEDWLDRYGLTA